jgi:signal transduction histidine kinase
MALLWRRTADGHWIEFGINEQAFERRTRLMALTLGSLLLFIGLAYVFVRRLLRPLDDISAGAQRFGAGAFNRPIAVRAPHRPDELGELAITINTMARDIEHMLDAKRALLLAISHELRSPLTRARLNLELLPDDEALRAPREALQRDLQEMARLITDLLESERLASRHAALHREAVDLGALVQGVLADLSQRHARASEVSTVMAADLPPLALDPARVRLLLRNLLDNALRHTPAEAAPPEVLVQWDSAGQRLSITVRDHGPGVPEQLLPQLAEPFFRPDSARTRSAGGVGLGLTLCRLVAQAHGGELVLSNAQPGLRAEATLGV